MADDHDGHRGEPDDVLRHAPEEQATERAAAVAAEDDHVGPLRIGGFQDGFSWLTFPDEKGDRDTFTTTSLHELLRRGLAAFPDLVDSSAEAAARKAKRGRVDDTHDEQLGSKSARDLKRFVGCRSRGR